MIEETIKLNRQIAPNRLQISIYYPYPKTDLYDICKQEGYLTKKHKLDFFEMGTTLNLPTLTEEQINTYFIKFRELAAESYIKTYHPKLLFIYKGLKFTLRSRTAPLVWRFKRTV